jgi:hypothetical protein
MKYPVFTIYLFKRNNLQFLKLFFSDYQIYLTNILQITNIFIKFFSFLFNKIIIFAR